MVAKLVELRDEEAELHTKMTEIHAVRAEALQILMEEMKLAPEQSQPEPPVPTAAEMETYLSWSTEDSYVDADDDTEEPFFDSAPVEESEPVIATNLAESTDANPSTPTRNSRLVASNKKAFIPWAIREKQTKVYRLDTDANRKKFTARGWIPLSDGSDDRVVFFEVTPGKGGRPKVGKPVPIAEATRSALKRLSP